MPLIKGENLNEAQRKLVLSTFINRDTVESPWNATARRLDGRDPQQTPTDEEWLRMRAFYLNNDGTEIVSPDPMFQDVVVEYRQREEGK